MRPKIADMVGRWPCPIGVGRGCRRLAVRLKRFFIFVMHNFLGAGDSGMMGVKVHCDLFLFMVIWTVVAEVTILVGKLETRQIFLVDRCNW